MCEEKEGRRRWWGESRGREHRRCLKTGSGHKGNRTLAYAWLFYSMPRVPKPLSPLPSYGSPREGTPHRCTRMPAKYHVIIRRAPTGFIYLHQSRISNRAQRFVARCSRRGESLLDRLQHRISALRKIDITRGKYPCLDNFIPSLEQSLKRAPIQRETGFNPGRHGTTWTRRGAKKASASAARGRGYVSASAFTTYRASRPPTAPSYP